MFNLIHVLHSPCERLYCQTSRHKFLLFRSFLFFCFFHFSNFSRSRSFIRIGYINTCTCLRVLLGECRVFLERLCRVFFLLVGKIRANMCSTDFVHMQLDASPNCPLAFTLLLAYRFIFSPFSQSRSRYILVHRQTI